MSHALWARRPPPPPEADAVVLGRWQPGELADLTADRRRLAQEVRSRLGPARADDSSIERLLLLFEELGSNALRHGRRPVQLTVTTSATFWLLTVCDTAVESPPIPAIDRDAAKGGLGLYLVARLCDDHGWTVDGAQKIAWARIGYDRANATAGAAH